MYVSVVTISTQDDNKFLKQLKSGFNWIRQPWFKTTNKFYWQSSSKCYTPKVEIKEFNVLIDGNIFLDLPIKKKT